METPATRWKSRPSSQTGSNGPKYLSRNEKDFWLNFYAPALRGHVEPDRFATVLYCLGMFYNRALIACENNNQGLTTNTYLKKELFYPRVYSDVRVDKVTNKRTDILGFGTTS